MSKLFFTYRAGVRYLLWRATLLTRRIVFWRRYFAEIHAEYPEYETVQSGPDAVAKTSNASDHALRNSLLIDMRLIGNVGTNGWIADAGDGREKAREPDKPGLSSETVQS